MFELLQSEEDEFDFMELESLPYTRANCLSQCRQVSSFDVSNAHLQISPFSQSYIMKFCNCSVALFFPTEDYPECNISSLVCMIPHNDFVNAIKPAVKNEFFDENEEGMECSCLPECIRIAYSYELNAIYDEKKIDPNEVLIDVNYKVTNNSSLSATTSSVKRLQFQACHNDEISD